LHSLIVPVRSLIWAEGSPSRRRLRPRSTPIRKSPLCSIFAPVVRRCKRHDGSTYENQRDFVVGLAETGSTDQAAVRLERTASGAWEVRKSAGGEGFDAAWDRALALYDSRNPRPRAAPTGEGGRWARHRVRPAPPPAHGEPEEGEPYSARRFRFAGGRGLPRHEPTEEELRREAEALLAGLLDRYRRKLRAERECRLAGRIVEAGFYVRQLTCIEVALDLGGRADALYDLFRAGDLDVLETVATPMAVLLDALRRDYWREKGEPDRFDPALLGAHDESGARGHASGHEYDSARDGDFNEWRARRQRIEAVQAEAQILWEKKAKRDARAWAKREAQAGGGAGAAEDQK
jgi:hypothetical protein